MTDYISREAAIKRFNFAVLDCLGMEPTIRAGDIIKALESIPAADVRPVITCGKCKHWVENGTDYCSCDRDALLRERDFFCAAGEKREES